jgi:hypothetical protein
MRPRRSLIVAAMLLAMPGSAYAGTQAARGATPGDETAARGAAAAAGSRSLLDQAYLDAASILGNDNPCSRFFGGVNSEGVLGRLATQLREGMLGDSRVGIRMSGPFTFHSRPEEISYRLFAEAVINTAGPFYKAKAFPADPRIPNVGSFRPNTNGARVLMLLHELAHLLEGPDRGWLIPDDAHDTSQNARNTALVESMCRRQILSLSD